MLSEKNIILLQWCGPTCKYMWLSQSSENLFRLMDFALAMPYMWQNWWRKAFDSTFVRDNLSLHNGYATSSGNECETTKYKLCHSNIWISIKWSSDYCKPCGVKINYWINDGKKTPRSHGLQWHLTVMATLINRYQLYKSIYLEWFIAFALYRVLRTVYYYQLRNELQTATVSHDVCHDAELCWLTALPNQLETISLDIVSSCFQR